MASSDPDPKLKVQEADDQKDANFLSRDEIVEILQIRHSLAVIHILPEKEQENSKKFQVMLEDIAKNCAILAEADARDNPNEEYCKYTLIVSDKTDPWSGTSWEKFHKSLKNMVIIRIEKVLGKGFYGCTYMVDPQGTKIYTTFCLKQIMRTKKAEESKKKQGTETQFPPAEAEREETTATGAKAEHEFLRQLGHESTSHVVQLVDMECPQGNRRIPTLLHFSYEVESNEQPHDGESTEQPDYVCDLILLKFCTGEPLSSLIKKKHVFDETEVRDIIDQMYEALAFIHKKRIVHLDLKPDNIIYDEKDRCLTVVDFGAACTSSALESNRKSKGMREYRAPELWFRDTCTEAVDVYSFGCILYALITGNEPFHLLNNNKKKKENMREQMKERGKSDHRNSPVHTLEARNTYSDAVNKFVSGLMIWNPEERMRIWDTWRTDTELGRGDPTQGIPSGTEATAEDTEL